MIKRISCIALCTILVSGIFVQQVTAMEDLPDIEAEIVADTEIGTEADLPAEDLPEEAPEEASGEADEADAQAPAEETAEPALPGILVDGVLVEDAAPSVYEQTTYVSLRSVAQALRPDAVITWEGDHAEVSAEGLSISVYPDRCYLIANGRYLYLPCGVRVENGSILVPVRTLAQAMDAQVEWDAVTGNTNLHTGSGAILSGNLYYDANSLYLLSHIINAESGNQPLNGKIAVGNVILNRVKSPIFPNTLYEVIYQKNQFSPAYNGSIDRTPNEESVIAAKLCLDGAVVLSDALWFNRAGLNCWASRNKSCVATIGSHAFYAE